jgi:hypothetical protein
MCSKGFLPEQSLFDKFVTGMGTYLLLACIKISTV